MASWSGVVERGLNDLENQMDGSSFYLSHF